ncbi:MAG: zinc ribbon domain-containing protein [Gemmatimonadetes bacterium]|nr:zinc ribbon domain-containing protein [Gemmatimonadota bacterium]
MPTYEYRCRNGHEFEQFQRMTDPPVAKCPACGADAERLLSAGAGLLFKGSGFYITDYRSDRYKKAAEAEKGGGEKSGKPSAAGGEGEKSARPPETKAEGGSGAPPVSQD